MTNERKWLNRKFRELRQSFGGVCKKCGTTEDLEFAHVLPTKLDGEGRGKRKRYYDIKNNPHAYIQLCRTCHYFYDQKNNDQNDT